MTWRDRVASLPSLAPARFELDAPGTALVLVDLQYVCAHPDYGLGPGLRSDYPAVHEYYYPRVADLVLPNARRLLAAFRGDGLRVVHLRLGPELPDGGDMIPLRRPETAPGLVGAFHHAGTFEHGILPEVAPAPGELVLNKSSRSAFTSTGIDHALRNMGVATLVVAGVSTSACVETTGRDAADRGFQVVLVEDATAEYDEASHEATLCQFAVRFGRVWTTDETLEVLRQLREAPEPQSSLR